MSQSSTLFATPRDLPPKHSDSIDTPVYKNVNIDRFLSSANSYWSRSLRSSFGCKEVGSASWVQILNEAVWISHSANTLGRVMNPTILLPGIGKL